MTGGEIGFPAQIRLQNLGACAACFFRQMVSANDFGIICRNHLPRAHPSPEADGQIVSANNSEISCRNHLPRTRAQKLILGSIKSGPASGLFFQNFPAPAAGFFSIFSAPAAAFFFYNFFGACGGLCLFKNCRRLRRALFVQLFRRLRRALVSLSLNYLI